MRTGISGSMRNKLKKPYLFLTFLMLGGLLYILCNIQPVCRYSNGTPFTVTNSLTAGGIRYFDVSDEGFFACNERTSTNNYIMAADRKSGKAQWMAGDDILADYCGTLSRYDVVLGDAGELYLHYVGWSGNNAAIEYERIMKISADGKRFMDVGGIGYQGMDDRPTRTPRLCAFSFRDGALHFCYTDSEGVSFYKIDAATDSQVPTGYYVPEDGVFTGHIIALDQDYLLVESDGMVRRINDAGEITDTVYECSVSAADPEAGDFIGAAAELDGKLYVTAGYRQDKLYMLQDGTMTQVADLNSLAKNPGADLFWEKEMTTTQMKSADGVLYLDFGGKLVTWDGETLAAHKTTYTMPAKNVLATLLPFINMLLWTASLVFLILFLVFVRKGLLLKQLMLMVPVLTIMSIGISREIGQRYLEIYFEKEEDGAAAVCELSAEAVDGDKLAGVIADPASDPQWFREARTQMLNTLDHNRNWWSGIYDLRISVPTESGYAMIVADTREDVIPFTKADRYLYPEYLDAFRLGENSDSSLYTIDLDENEAAQWYSDFGKDMIVAATAIRDSSGKIAGYMVLSTDTYSLGVTQALVMQILMKTLIPCLAGLILIIVLVSLLISLRIRKATDAVSRIADGDLAFRMKSRSEDELGEICRQVDTMAENLEEMFDEKDRNEQFYYKFVPEKFRELLGKEKITDLALGDAKSQEFTVLFCDIRSFSINSEMLTAKESFEFANVVYGIAGPIIRECGGFVDKYIGDAVMALFEEPDAAIRAGIRMYREIVQNPETAEKLHVHDINIGVGIHTGMASIGIVGEDERLSGTVISDTVNISSRLESLTKMYHTAMIVTKDTLDRMADPDMFSRRYLGMVQVAGVNDVNGLYEILDCLEETERKKREENKADFREGVRLFHLGRRKEAVEQFAKIIDEGRADFVTEKYHDYIRSMSDEDKGNVFRFNKK